MTTTIDHRVVSIVTRPPDPEPDVGEDSRTGDEWAIGRLRPSGALLPSDGAPSPAPAPTPIRALALDALLLLRWISGTVAPDPAWSAPAFARSVDAIRRQLAPIRSRRGLVASFEREAAHLARVVPATPLGPVRFAYAVRWLELGDGQRRPPWPPGPVSRRHVSRGPTRPRRRPRVSRQS